MNDTLFQGLIPESGKHRKARKATGGAEKNAVLRKTVGDRFRAARAINGWGQSEAAGMFDYKNSTQLSLIEDGKRMPPYTTLLKAHEIYGVSIDYLLGRSDEPERDPKAAERQAMAAQVKGMLTQTANVFVHQFQRYLTAGAPAVSSSRAFLQQAEECTKAIQRCYELNPDKFDSELKAGAMVLRTMDALNTEIIRAKAILDRHERVGEDVVNTAARRLGNEYPLLDQIG